MKNILVTFDIDSTLLKTFPNSPHSRSLRFAMKELFGIDVCPSQYLNVSFCGCSDEWIVREIIKKATASEKPPKATRDEFVRIAGDHFEQILDAEKEISVLPGIFELLRKLRSYNNVVTGLCSGNIPKIGWCKIEKAKLGEFFPEKIAGLGGFEDRADILRSAIRDAEEKTGKKFEFCNVFHVGDAPQDVIAANDVGVNAIAVKTGYFGDDSFKKPCVIVENCESGFDTIIKTILGNDM